MCVHMCVYCIALYKSSLVPRERVVDMQAYSQLIPGGESKEGLGMRLR